MFALAQDLRFAFRQLRKAPRFALLLILVFGAGIGSTTAIFSLVQGVLLRPLPFNHPDRLVILGDHLGDNEGISVSAREIPVYASAAQAFSGTGGYLQTSYEVSGGSMPERVNAARLNASVFSTLSVAPILGRTFTQQEEDARKPVAIISYSQWVNRYHLDPQVLGSAIILNRKAYSIIGVMPRDFDFPPPDGRLNQSQLWVPLSLTAEELAEENAGMWGYQIVARLKDRVTFTQAAQDADRVAQQVMRGLPASQSTIRLRGDVTPLLEYEVSEVRPLLKTLFLAVSVVLLISCTNVAGLLLVRAIRRRGEFAVRLAFGARSGAIVRQSLLEGLVLGAAGAAVGLAFAATAIRIALRALPDSMPRIDSIAVDSTVFTFAVLLAFATSALCSLAPAFAALRTEPLESLKAGSRTGTGSSSHAWLRSGLVVSEVAIALVLLIASGGLLRSFQKMRAVDPGFRPDHVVVAGYQLPLNQYPTVAAGAAFSQEVLARLSHKPGILAAGSTNTTPAIGGFPETAYTIEGAQESEWKPEFSIFAIVSGDYFRVMSIPLRDGRYFTGDEHSSSPLVVIVNETMAKHCWPGEHAVGKRMHAGGPTSKLPWATVIGVVADTKMGSPDEPSSDQWYTPMEQPATLMGTDHTGRLTVPTPGYIAVRSQLPAEQTIRTLRSAVAEVDSFLALEQVQTMNEAVANIEAPRRFNTSLISLFALFAVLLATTGIYAVVAFSASLRTHEIAIRMALGAPRSRVASLVLISGAKLALMGCVLGLLASLAVSRMVGSLLFEVSAIDPAIYVAGGLGMMVIATLACALPATRAASVDPSVALR